MDVVTFTVTLPINAPLGEYITALRSARDSQARLGNFDAAQALHCILTLAEKGLSDVMAKTSHLHILPR